MNPAQRWDIDRVLDRLYDLKTTPAWLLVALEDVRQELRRANAVQIEISDRRHS